jgi:hypothetical protein
MRSRTLIGTSAEIPTFAERKTGDTRPATRRDYCDAPAVTLLSIARTSQSMPSRVDTLGCQIELLEEFLSVVAQGPNATIAKKQTLAKKQ